MTHWERLLERWQSAGLIDPSTAGRIRQFESQSSGRGGGLRWPVLAALALGALMLGAGILLFVGAQWESLSPGARMALVLAMVAGFHGAGAWQTTRFPALATALHALGTVSLGAAVFLAGQIFNLEEHWPNGVLLWAAGAVAGWYLLRDWPHAVLAGILVPAWVFAEWLKPVRNRGDAGYAFLAVLAFTYLSAESRGHDALWRRALAWIGALALIPTVVLVAAASSRTERDPLWASALAYASPLALAWLLRETAAWKNAVSAAWVLVLSLLPNQNVELSLLAWLAFGSAALIGWGIDDARAARVNLGMGGFALTVLLFYYSELMDKLGRSLSMIVLGLLFLGGGWCLERLRRRLIARIGENRT